MFATGQVNLTEAWRWQNGTALRGGIDGGVASSSPDGSSLFVAGGAPTNYLLQPRAEEGFSEETSAPIRGGSSAAARLAVFKLDGSTGEQLWVFEGSANAVGEAVAIGVDGGGDVIVGGMTTTTTAAIAAEGVWHEDEPNFNKVRNCAAFKLDGDTGEQLWSYHGTVYESDSATPSTTTSGNNNDSSSSSISSGYYTTIGAILSLSVDSAGNALFVGQTRGDSPVVLDDDEVNHTHTINSTIGKLDGTTGELMWAVQGGAIGPVGMLSACETDSQDNLVAAGITEGDVAAPNAGGGDFFVVKLSGDGEEIWAWQDGTENNETLLAVAIDAQDNIYVAGGEAIYQDPSIPGANASIVLKLDGSTGQELWRYSGEPDDSSSSSFSVQHPMPISLFRGLAVDNSTGIIVAAGMAEGAWASGQTSSSSHGGYDFAAVALNATSGEELGRWQAGTALQDGLNFAGFDSAGGLYLGGYSEGTSWTSTGSSSSNSTNSSSSSFGGEGTTSGIAVVKFEPSSSPGYLHVMASSSASSTTSSDDGDDLETWQLVVGMVALTAALLLLVCMACLIRRSRRNKALDRSVEDLSGAIVRCAPASEPPLSITEISPSPQAHVQLSRAELSPSPVPLRNLSRGYLGSWNSAKGEPGKSRSRRSLWVSRILRVGAPDTPLRSGTKISPKETAASHNSNNVATSPIAGKNKTEAPPSPPGSCAGGGADEGMEEQPLTPEWRIPPPPSYPSPFPPVRREDSDLPDDDLALEPGLASYDSASESVALGSRLYTDVEAGLGLFNEWDDDSGADRSLRRDDLTRGIHVNDTHAGAGKPVVEALQGPRGRDAVDNLVSNGRGRSSTFPIGVGAESWGPPVVVFGGREDSAAASSSVTSGSDSSLRSDAFIGIAGRADSAAASVFPGYGGYESSSPRVGLGEREDSAAGSTFHEPAENSRFWRNESQNSGFVANAGALPRYPRGGRNDSESDLSVGWGEIAAGGVRGRVSLSGSSSGESDARASEDRRRRMGLVQANPFPRRKPSRRIPIT